jgi:hypothetical protein
LISIPQREVRDALQSHDVCVSLLHGQLSEILGACPWWRMEKLHSTCGSLELVEIAGYARASDHNAVNLLVARSGQTERQTVRLVPAIVTDDEYQCNTGSSSRSVNLSGAPSVGYKPSDIRRDFSRAANFCDGRRRKIQIHPIFNVCVSQNFTSRLM